jgi:uncharacterized membrane protein YeaQ/YmgE (transglycosylase-associated protein family)
MLGLELANSVQFVVHTIVIAWIARRTFGLAHLDRFWSVTRRCTLTAAVMAAVAFLVWLGLDRVVNDASGTRGVLREVILVIVPAALGGAVYVALSLRLRIEEVTTIVNAVVGRILRFR